jgi:hypothetical protein
MRLRYSFFIVSVSVGIAGSRPFPEDRASALFFSAARDFRERLMLALVSDEQSRGSATPRGAKK